MEVLLLMLGVVLVVFGAVVLVVFGAVVLFSSDDLGEFILSLFLLGVGCLIISIGVNIHNDIEKTKDVITITSKDNKTFSLVTDNPELKLEKDSLNYHDLDSIVKTITKTK